MSAQSLLDGSMDGQGISASLKKHSIRNKSVNLYIEDQMIVTVLSIGVGGVRS